MRPHRLSLEREINMFRWLKSLLSVFKNDTLVMQFENMLIAEEAIKRAEEPAVAVVPEPVAEVVPEPAVVPEPVAEVVPEPPKVSKSEIAKKRTRKVGKFVADDPTTPDVNEAFLEGKSPVKKTAKRKKK